MDYFPQCSCLKNNPCVLFFLLFPWLTKKLSQLPKLELDSLLSKFYGSVRTKNLWMVCIKANIDYSFIRGMVENYCTLGKIQSWPTIHLSPTGLGVRASVNGRPRLNFTLGDNIFALFPSWAVNICIINMIKSVSTTGYSFNPALFPTGRCNQSSLNFRHVYLFFKVVHH